MSEEKAQGGDVQLVSGEPGTSHTGGAGAGETVHLKLPVAVALEEGQNFKAQSGEGGLKIGGGRMPAGSVMFNVAGTEVVRLGPDGFFVSGRKVTEDTEVYEGFKKFLRMTYPAPFEWPKDKGDLTKIFVDAEARGDQNVKTLSAVALALLEVNEERIDTMQTLLDHVFEIAAAYKKLNLLLKAETIEQLDNMVRTLIGMPVDEKLLAEEVEIKTLSDTRVRMTVRGSHWGMKAIAKSLGPSLKREDGQYWNNLEWVTETPGAGEVVITLQRRSGPTKGELLNQAETKLLAARAAIEAAITKCGCETLRPIDPGLTCTPCDILRKALADTVPGPRKDDSMVVGGAE